ncbi:MAG: hypothetical protein HYV60_09280, partial [Planctomycetia bacterium]|nr:hypothetical protein [Planctomycetia bacterium]
MNFCRSLFAGLILAAMFSSPAPANQHVSLPLLQALEAMRMGEATIAQTALLFQNNDVINQARLNGWITDNHYQAAQKDFASRNAEFAKRAATEAGADFTPQKSKSTSYSPGTDSDFIATVKGNDPVGQIADMQARYNRNVNDFLKNSLESDGMHFQSRSDWHNRLDVDFMADPR